jgi:three-Cys-motif partner protein
MVRSARHFEAFEPHTLLKHAILRAYEERWARVLLVGNPHRTRVRIVDACAGAGQDEIGNPGSPLISIREAERAREQIATLRKEPVEIQVVAIEKDGARYSQLASLVQAFGTRHLAWLGTLGDYISQLEQDFTRTPTLFFIDPFGLDPLQANIVRRALTGPTNEVLLLFADQAALRHIGAAAATEAAENPELSLFGDQEAVEPAPPSREVKVTSEAANRIMNAAFGDERWKKAMSLPAGQRRQVVVDMYADLLRSMGASHVLRLPMYGSRNRLKYHLMFATRSGKGYQVMKESVERAWNHDLLEDKTVQLMKMGTACPTTAVEQAVRAKFAGREVPWTTRDRQRECVRTFVLQETEAMPHQLGELKQRLAPLQLRMRATVYAFPPVR